MNSSNVGVGVEVTAENVASSSKKSTSTRPGPKKKPSAEQWYECPMCHAGKGDSTKSYPWGNEDTTTRKDGDASMEHVWKYAVCHQKHVAKYHLWSLRRPATGDYVCSLCQCTWDPESCARFKEDGEILNHISTEHSDPSKTHYSFDHGCSALLLPPDANEASGAPQRFWTKSVFRHTSMSTATHICRFSVYHSRFVTFERLNSSHYRARDKRKHKMEVKARITMHVFCFAAAF